MLEMVDGPARERLHAVLRSAWAASDLAAATPLVRPPAHPAGVRGARPHTVLADGRTPRPPIRENTRSRLSGVA